MKGAGVVPAVGHKDQSGGAVPAILAGKALQTGADRLGDGLEKAGVGEDIEFAQLAVLGAGGLTARLHNGGQGVPVQGLRLKGAAAAPGLKQREKFTVGFHKNLSSQYGLI